MRFKLMDSLLDARSKPLFGNRVIVVVVLLLLVAMSGMSCSRKGVYMPRHRKAHRCNTCPTFSERVAPVADQTVWYQ